VPGGAARASSAGRAVDSRPTWPASWRWPTGSVPTTPSSTGTGLEELHGALYCLQAAIEDVDGDLAASRTKQDLEDALRWLLENARPLADLRIEPRAALDPGLGP